MLSTSIGLLAVAAVWFQQTFAQNSSNGLNFGPVNFGGYNNYVYRDNVTSAQIVLSQGSSSTTPSRFITAFPNGNTGSLIYFVPFTSGTTTNGQGLGTTLDPTSVTSISGQNNQTGVTGTLSISGDLVFGVTLIGGVRTLRDYTESGGTVFHSIFNYTLGNYNSQSIQLVRNWINGSTVQFLQFDVVNNGQFSVSILDNPAIPPTISLVRPNNGQNVTLKFTSTFNFTTTTPTTPYVPLVGLGPNQLFLNSSSSGSSGSSGNNLGNVISAIQNNGSAIANQLSFLGYQSKFLAGGWRFLTYFGRDTLIALRLLLPVFSQTSTEAILGAVLERMNETGTICHEETIGDYASFVNIQNNQSQLGNTPFYSYVMVDTDFLLLPVLSDYFLNTPAGKGRASTFLNQSSKLKSGTYNQLLLENVNHVMNLSQAFATNPNVYSNLVQIRDANVGNWRDSNSGLGYGKYPFDVNVALVPAALRAISKLSDPSVGILPSNYSNTSTAYANIWESNSYKYFQVGIDSTTAMNSLNNYVQAANLSNTALYGAGSLNKTQGVVYNSSTSTQGWNSINQTIGMEGSGNSTYFALSLLQDGTPVQVLNSDLAFVLSYADNLPQSVLQAVVEAMQPYPRGLLTNVGMVVANTAYNSNRTAIPTFSNLAYHGAVSWSFQQGLMASGLSRQLNLCSLSTSTQISSPSTNTTQPSFCSNLPLVANLLQAQTRLWYSIAGSASALYTEVFSPVWSNSSGTFSIGDLGALSPEGTEGDAIQLWSYGFLSQIDPRSGKPVAAGLS